MNCVECGLPIEECNRCYIGYIHSGTGFHSCADKQHMARPEVVE